MDTIISDFAKKLTPQGAPMPPQYAFVHIIFNKPLKAEYMEKLFKQSPLLLNSLCTLKQICYTVHPIDEGLFSVKLIDDLKIKPNTPHVKMENNILSILSFIRKIQNLQIVYDMDNADMNRLVEEVSPSIQKVVDSQHMSYSSQKVPPVFLILLDRKKDLVTPLLQNNSYSSMYYNLMKHKENVLDFEVNSGQDPPEQGKSLLNENDFIWLDHKYNSFLEVINIVNNDYKQFMEKNANSQGGDVLEQMRKAPELKEYIKDFNKHLVNLNKIMKVYNEKKFDDVFFYEQCLATGQNKEGNPFSPTSIDKSKIPDPYDQIRLAVLGKLLHGMDDQTIQNVIFQNKDSKMLSEVKEICQILQNLSGQDIERIDIQTEGDSSDRMFYRSRAAHIVYEKIFGKLAETYDNFGTKDFSPKKMPNKIFDNYIFKKNRQFEDSPLVIVFMIGGLSINEVMEINNLKKKSQLGDFIPICGGTNVYSARSFIEYLTKQEVVEED